MDMMETHNNKSKNNKSKSNHHHHNHLIVMRKMRGLLPSSLSSCQFRSIPDVAESSITITTTTKSSSSSSKNTILNSSKKPSTPLRRHSPPLTPVKKHYPVVCVNHHSSSSHSGLFTSSDDKTRGGDVHDLDFSLSSNSGDSFRLKPGRRFSHQVMMKSIDEVGPSSLKAAATGQTKVSKTVLPGSDYIFTQLYYQKKSSKSHHLRRRKIKKGAPILIGESYAVEKSSSDPYADFRASMVEMILHRQLFGSQDLERLLLCFLSLNAASYHGIIYHVFSDICQTLFAN